jgi:8-oxo-dGTP diphosphatase
MVQTRFIVSCLVRDGDRYLFITQNKPGGAYPGTLHIPGGGLEENETPEQGVVREVREEVGIEIQNVRPFDFDWETVDYKGAPTQLVFLRFLADHASGEAVAATDAKSVTWISAGEVGQHPHNPPSVRLLTRLGLLDG